MRFGRVRFRVLALHCLGKPLHARQSLAFGGRIIFQCIGDDRTWNVRQSFEQFTEKSSGGILVAVGSGPGYQARCHPGPEPTAGNTSSLEWRGKLYPGAICRHHEGGYAAIHWWRSKLQTPLPNRFAGDDDPVPGVVRSSTSRKLSEKRKDSQTAWLIISRGKR